MAFDLRPLRTSEVPGEVLDRVEREARIVEIRPEEEMEILLEEKSVEPDRPNPPWLVRKVRLRDGGMCANTFCRRQLGLHAHHIVFRAGGGRTALPNLVMVCQYCHSLLHSGLLEIRGNPISGLTWRTRCDSLEPTLEEDRAEVAAIPLVVPAPPVDPPPATQGSGHPDPSKESQAQAGPVVTGNGAAPESETPEKRAFLGLRRLGHSSPEARERIRRAREKLAGRVPPPEDGEILRAALTG